MTGPTVSPKRGRTGMRNVPVPLTSLYLFCGPAEIDGRMVSASEQAEQVMRAGGAAMALPPGSDATAISWPPVPHVALFAHDGLDDSALRALASALIDAGADYVSVTASSVLRRGPFTYGAAT